MLKVVLSGSSGVGKTGTIRRLQGQPFTDRYERTSGVECSASEVVLSDNRELKLLIWDTTGNSEQATFTSAFYQGADVIILMFDITNTKSFSDLATLWMKLVKDSIYPKALPSDKNLLVVGNKADLLTERKITLLDAQAYADEIGAEYFETSAKTGMNVNGLLEHCGLLGKRQNLAH